MRRKNEAKRRKGGPAYQNPEYLRWFRKPHSKSQYKGISGVTEMAPKCPLYQSGVLQLIGAGSYEPRTGNFSPLEFAAIQKTVAICFPKNGLEFSRLF